MQDLYTSAADFPVLTLMIGLPLLAAIATAFLRDPMHARQVALAGTAATALLAVVALFLFQGASGDYQLVERLPWLPSLGVDYALGVDGISILLLPLTAALFLGVQLVAPEARRARNRWVEVNLLVLLSATLGVFAATDAILFFVFFEIGLVPGYFLIKLAGSGTDPARAARQYMVVMLLGSLPILAGLVLAGVAVGEASGRLSFDIVHLTRTPLPAATGLAVFAFLLFGFAVKAPALPLHLWMRSSVAVAPTSMMAWLLGIKVGTYGFLRFVIPLSPAAAADYAPWVIGVEVLAIAYAGLIALSRRDLRSLLVFSSIGHVGLMTAAAFSGTSDGWRGAVLLMVNATIATGGLALAIGMIERRLGTSDLRAMGGLMARAPQLAALVFAAGLALIGVPGTSGFAGEILALKGVFDAHWAFGLVAVSGVVLGAGYFLLAWQRGFVGPVEKPAVATVRDLVGAERWVAAGVIVLVVGLGLVPGATERLTRATVNAHIARHEAVAAQSHQRPLRIASEPGRAATGR